jgi:hypothetical protein
MANISRCAAGLLYAMLEKGPAQYRSSVLKLIASAFRSTPRPVAARLMHESDPDSPPFVLMRALQGDVCRLLWPGR